MKVRLSYPTPNVQIDGLTETETAMLAFERQRWKHAGAKDTAIYDTFAMLPVRYYQQLNALLDNTAALAADPLLVNRLRRLRETRQRGRSKPVT